MVQVAHTAPALTGIIVLAEAIAIVRGPFLRITTVIVLDDVCRYHLISNTVIGLFREIYPVADVLAMVDHHVGDCPDTSFLQSVDE